MSIRTRYAAQGTGSGGSAAGAAQDEVAGDFGGPVVPVVAFVGCPVAAVRE